MAAPISILIVEDSIDDYYLLAEVLNATDEITTRITHHERLQDAMTAAADNAPDVAVIDLDLPDSFGLETFLSFHRRFPHIPAVVMTGLPDRALALEAVKSGAQDYLHKGETSDTVIIRTIRNAIERHRLMVALSSARQEINTLRGIIPICAYCKQIRDDEGYWNKLEAYISKHSEAEFSHSICPDCARAHFPDLKL